MARIKYVIIFLLFAGIIRAQSHHGLPLVQGGTAPWNSGDAGKVLTSNGTSAPSWNSPAVTTYAVTTTDATNTTATIDILSISIPANTWADGQTIEFNFINDTKQNSGAGDFLTVGGSWNGNTGTVPGGALSISNNSSEGERFVTVYVTRIGSSIYYSFDNFQFGVMLNASSGQAIVNNYYVAPSQSGMTLTTQSFTSTANLTISLKWGTASANAFYKILTARAFKVNN